MLCFHTCPLATLGGKETGGMNVYVRELTRELGRRGWRWMSSPARRMRSAAHPARLGYGNRVIHMPAGPEAPYKRPGRRSPCRVRRGRAGIRRGEGHPLRRDSQPLLALGPGRQRDLRARGARPIVQMFHTLGHMKNQRRPAPRRDGAAQHRIDGEGEIMRFADRIVAATPLDERSNGQRSTEPTRKGIDHPARGGPGHASDPSPVGGQGHDRRAAGETHGALRRPHRAAQRHRHPAQRHGSWSLATAAGSRRIVRRHHWRRPNVPGE